MASGAHSRSRRILGSATQSDRFLDVIVLISVGLVVLLAAGVGLLALRASLR